MILEHEVERAVNTHGSASRIVGHCSRDRPAGGFIYFVDSADVEGSAQVRIDLFHQITVAVVNELCRFEGCARDAGSIHLMHCGKQVLEIIVLFVRDAILHATGHIAVGVVRVGLSGTERSDGMDVKFKCYSSSKIVTFGISLIKLLSSFSKSSMVFSSIGYPGYLR